MTKQEKDHEILIFLCIAKLFSDTSTILIGELRHDKKQRFNQAVQSVDAFIKCIEADVNDYNKETLQILADSMNDGITNLRKELKEAK